METIDLRSDTVTQPSPAMRQAMFEAAVGDDIFGDDPTVNELERRAAVVTGKEAAVFVASGTMGNVTALLTHTERGDEVIVGARSHILLAEVGGAGALAGAVLRPVQNDARGRLDVDEVAETIRADNVHYPRTRLLCIENTHNQCNGSSLSLHEFQPLADLAHARGLAVHMDGARIFNAAVALGVPVAALAAPADTITFCLSKGLACPAGSLLCGSEDFIRRARRYRKMLGGGMRQVGFLAAAGIVALDSMVERLAEDHANARLLAEGLSRLPGIEIDPASVETNILFFRVTEGSTQDFVRRMGEAGVLGGGSARSVRFVTHYGIERAHVEDALTRIGRLVRDPVPA